MSAYKLQAQQNLVNWAQTQRDYDVLREQGEIVRVDFPFGGEGWMTTTYDLARKFYNDPTFSIEKMMSMSDYPRIRQIEASNAGNPSFLQYDGAKHQAKRAVLMKHLTVKRVNAMRARTQEFIDAGLDDFEAQGSPADITTIFARLVPLHVLCAMLGTPTITDRDFIESCYLIVDSRAKTMEDVIEAYTIQSRFFSELYEEKVRNPGDDLMSAMIQDTADGLWTADELRSLGTTLLAAAHDATGAMLNGMLEWLSYEPELYQRLRQEPESFPRAFEELFRLVSVGIGVARGRVAAEDTDLGGVHIKEGEAVGGNLLAAHFDPAAFPNPTAFDMDRENPNPHLAFGYGPHACPGAQLARMEISLALKTVLQRYERFENVQPSEGWRERRLLKGAPEVVIRWERA